MRTSSRVAVPIGLLALVAGCADNTPARIEVNAPPVIVKQGTISIEAAVLNRDGRRIEGEAVTFSGSPEDVIDVGRDGSLRCRGTGDATVHVAGGGLGADVPVKCRIPTEIVLPEQRQFLLGGGSVALQARALGGKGRPMNDVPVILTSSDPSVVKIDGMNAVPVAVGNAVLKGTAGGVYAVSAVEVVEKVVGGPLRLADGESRTFRLGGGSYRVEIEVTPSHKVEQGVTASWDGANCERQGESRSHRFSCDVREGATLTVANPKSYGLGVPVAGTITVYRVPPG